MADDGGLSKFQRRMRAIPLSVRQAVQPALVKGADEIAGMARHLAPEDTGALKASIAVTGPGQQTPPYSQPGGSMTVPENMAAVTVGNSAVRYAHLVEYGTAEAEAQPFLGPASRLLKKRVGARIKRSISKAIREAGK